MSVALWCKVATLLLVAGATASVGAAMLMQEPVPTVEALPDGGIMSTRGDSPPKEAKPSEFTVVRPAPSDLK